MFQSLEYRRSIGLALLLVSLGTVTLRAEESDSLRAGQLSRDKQGKAAHNNVTTRPKITVSKETTYFLGPLDVEGYVDYLAALNAASKRGVTPENNAAVLFFQATGPGPVDVRLQKQFFKDLGVASPPPEGKYFIDWHAFYRSAKKLKGADWNQAAASQATDELEKVRNKPWAPKEHPLAAEWLEANAEPLRILLQATLRPRFYYPLIISPEHHGLFFSQMAEVGSARMLAVALIVRAMSRLEAGKTELAWQDVLACHRLARLIGQGPMVFTTLAATAIQGMASEATATLFYRGRLNRDQAKRYLADLRKLPPLSPIADKLMRGERAIVLDETVSIARRGPAEMFYLVVWLNALGDASTPEPKRPAHFPAGWSNELPFRWDNILRLWNADFDRQVSIARLPPGKQRIEAVDKYGEEMKLLFSDKSFLRGDVGAALLQGKVPAEFNDLRMSELLRSLFSFDLTQTIRLEDRTLASSDVVSIGMALTAYRADQGNYPSQLAELVPNYLPTLLNHRGLDIAFRYRRQGEGYVLDSQPKHNADRKQSYPMLDTAAEPIFSLCAPTTTDKLPVKP